MVDKKLDNELEELNIDVVSDVRGWFPTGNFLLDEVLNGGLAWGRIYDIHGEAATGKTLVALEIVKQALERKQNVFYLDVEGTVSRDLAEGMGFTFEMKNKKLRIAYKDRNMIYNSPHSIEDAFTLIEKAIKTEPVKKGAPLLVVWDTLASSCSQKELEAEHGKAQMGKSASIISQGFRKIGGILNKTSATLLILNQMRDSIGVFQSKICPGGHALEFYATGRIRLRVTGKIEEKDNFLGNTVKVDVIKLKVGMPYRSVTLPIYFANNLDEKTGGRITFMGINEIESAFYSLKNCKALTISGSSYKLILEDNKELKFMKRTWEKVYLENKVAIDIIVKKLL